MAKSPKNLTFDCQRPSPDSRRQFDAAFKQGAVTLSKRVGVSQAAKELQVGESNLRNWIQAVAAHGAQAFAPLSQRTDVDAELRRLREEVRVLRMEKDILKKPHPENLWVTGGSGSAPSW